MVGSAWCAMPASPAHAPKKRLGDLAQRLPRIVALRVAGEMVGQGALAEGLGVGARALRAYLGADRGISDETLTGAAKVLEAKAVAMIAHAEKLRGLACMKPQTARMAQHSGEQS